MFGDNRMPWPFTRSKRSAPSPTNSSTVFASPFFHTGDIQKNTTVQACINAIVNPISILPLNLYIKNQDGSRQKAIHHELYTLLRRRPNSSESPTQFISKMVRHIVQSGNAYLFKGFSGGHLVSLQLLNPEAVRRDTRTPGQPQYVYNGTAYTDAEILHIPGLVTDDVGTGISSVELARIAVQLGTQLDEYSLSSFGNGLNTKLLLDIAEMTKDVKNEEEASKKAAIVSDYIRRNYTGSQNSGKPLILWSGMKATELSHQSSNRDAELLESRKWQEAEICKIFGVPQWMINGTFDVKYGGVEQAMIVYLNFTLSPYLRHIEQRLATLLSAYEQDAYYFEFDFNVLLRPDEKARGEFYNKLFLMGAISPNGICAKENIEPIGPVGDTRFVPAQLMPLEQSVIDAYMASAKLKAEQLVNGTSKPDPSLSAGSQAQ